MKLYDNPMANSPRKVRMFLVEKNIADVEIVNIDLMQGEHKTPEYRAIAPNSRIPALQLDDGTVVMESTAICRYLESLYPEPNLFWRKPDGDSVN
ncbi:glutathione S-transferase N-terminal domain-containing protein [Gammaproteobacteria bacterium]|nr:glutathione S-transferase N-terminal domain-containing protein [Gammaproteobacteria bacterium]